MTPAQLTSRLMPPMAARADSIAAFTSASEVTSHLAKAALAAECRGRGLARAFLHI